MPIAGKLLSDKGRAVHSVPPGTTALEAARVMDEQYLPVYSDARVDAARRVEDPPVVVVEGIGFRGVEFGRIRVGVDEFLIAHPQPPEPISGHDSTAGYFATRNWPLRNYAEFCRLWKKDHPGTRFLIIGIQALQAKAAEWCLL